jgi:outer membrane biosynthesis protein TonB
LRRSQATSEDYPNAALRWGFEGWVGLESVVDADGTPASVRVLASYPPFVFNAAGTAIVERSRYEPVFVPPDGPCAATSQRIVFRLP